MKNVITICAERESGRKVTLTRKEVEYALKELNTAEVSDFPAGAKVRYRNSMGALVGEVGVVVDHTLRDVLIDYYSGNSPVLHTENEWRVWAVGLNTGSAGSYRPDELGIVS